MNVESAKIPLAPDQKTAPPFPFDKLKFQRKYPTSHSRLEIDKKFQN